MAGTVQGPLTDLERSNYTSDSDLVKSIIYVRQDGSGTYPVVPSQNAVLKTEYLTNAGSPDMNVDGSSTPVVFNWTPTGDVLLQRFQIAIVHINITDFNSFGNIGTLANGLEITPTVNGTPFTYATIKRNIDFTQFSTTTNSSFFTQQGNTTQNGIQFDITLDPPLIGNASNLAINVTVRDDLTALNYIAANAFYLEVV